MKPFLANLEALCAIDSPTGDLEGVDACASALAAMCRQAGCATELVSTPCGQHVIATVHGRGDGRIILLGHHDTVHPRGTAARRPLRIDGDRAVGPGTADMKAGLLVGMEALRRLAWDAKRAFPTIELHSVPDEEARNGPPALIDRLAGADAALCLECGRPGGAFVSARKAGVWLTLRASGRAAHAGTDRAEGRSALSPLMAELIRIEALDGVRAGSQLTVTRLMAGEASNTVPSRASATVDIRAETYEDLQAMIGQARNFADHGDVALSCSGEAGFPPMLPSPGLVEKTQAALDRAGSQAVHVASSGVSDANWTSHLGVPTVDGMGPVGYGDHTADENIELSSVVPRISALVDLCRTWDAVEVHVG